MYVHIVEIDSTMNCWGNDGTEAFMALLPFKWVVLDADH